MKLLINLTLLLLVIGGIIPFITLGPGGDPLFKLSDLKVPEFQLPPFLDPKTVSKQFSDATKSSKTKSIYKWYDANGQVHYTEAPPLTVTEAERLQLLSNTHFKIETKPNNQATMKIPKETGQSNASRTIGELYSTEGVQHIMESTRNIQNLLNERQEEYDRLLDKE